MTDVALRDQLIAWSNINSGSNHPAGLSRMCAVLRAAFAQLPGVTIEELPLPGTDARALRIQQRPGVNRSVLLSGHYDTVFGADHAFQQATLVDAEMLRGPGVADMKGGLVVLLAALTAFEQQAAAGKLGWEVLITPDEETGSNASRPVLEATARRHQLGLVFEPARDNGDLVQSRKGIGHFTLTCRGRAAHAARPEEGRNAILALAQVVLEVSRLPEQMPGVLVNVGSIEGGGAANVVPELARAGINVRIARAADAAAIEARLQAQAATVNARDGFRLEIDGGFSRMPMEMTAATQALFAAWCSCAEEVGAAPFSWVHVGGGSDGNLLSAAGLTCLDGLGPVGGHLHSASEYVRWPTLAQRARVAARFLEKFAAGEITLPA